MVGAPQEPLRILPAVIEPMSEEDFEEVTDLLADLILETVRRKRAAGEELSMASDKGQEGLSGSHRTVRQPNIP